MGILSDVYIQFIENIKTDPTFGAKMDSILSQTGIDGNNNLIDEIASLHSDGVEYGFKMGFKAGIQLGMECFYVDDVTKSPL